MSLQIKPGGRIGIIVILFVLGFFGYKWYERQPKDVGKATEVGKVVIPDAPDASLGASAVKSALPTKTPSLNGGVHITIAEMAWQAQTAVNYANGGERTTKGSLFDKAKLDVQIVRRDDCSQTVSEYIKATNDYKNGATKDGYFAVFMGTGIPNYIHQMAEGTKELGPEYAPILFFSSGRSAGEDQMIGDIKYKTNPQLLRGAVCVGVMLDGDQDVAIKYAGDNGIPVNPNEKLYDPHALNLAYPKDFLDAVVKYNNVDAREKRQIVINGKTTGKDTLVGYDLVATWTPGDVNARNGRGGATIISTKQYSAIMPCVFIACKKFLNDNRTAIEDFIDAAAQAGDQIKSYEDVKKYATNLNGDIWAEKSLDWYKLFNGYNSDDMHLGGSGVYNLADMAKLFGLSGSSDIYKEVYNTFAKLQTSMYPKEFAAYIPYQQAVDKSFMLSLIANPRDHAAGEAQTVQYADKITQTVASKAVHINFQTGSAIIEENSFPLLNQLYSDAITAEGLKVAVHGYTDNTGNPESNQTLSERRAAAVANYLITKGLPQNRVESAGFGQDGPVASNATSAGKAANRRVEIVLGQ